MKTSTKLIGLLGIIMILTALFTSANAINLDWRIPGFKDGVVADCTVKVNLLTFTQRLDIESATCNKGSTCSTLNPFFLGFGGDEPTGSVVLKQSGKTYASTDVIESNLNYFATAYPLTACVPSTTTQVQIQTLNSFGGTDDEVISPLN